MTAGTSLNQQDPTSCSVDFARVWAATLQQRLTCEKIHDTNIVALVLISLTMAPIGDLSNP
jgi:hypothetical protein